MKNIYKLLLASVLVVASTSACVRTAFDDSRSIIDPDYNGTYSYTYTLQKVMEYDPVNVVGIDVMSEFPSFGTMSLTIYYDEGKISNLEITEGDIPFSVYPSALPQGKVECYFDRSCYPNAIKLKSDNSTVALYKLGQFYIPFQLDCSLISYEYWFK